MPKTILRNASITVDAVDLSNRASSVTINIEKDDVELTSFGSAMHEHGVGLGDGSIDIDFYQDFAAASVDATLYPIFEAGVPVPVVIKPDDAAVSATNPSYTMQGLLMSYSPLAGSVGEASTMSVTFQNGDESGIVRAVA